MILSGVTPSGSRTMSTWFPVRVRVFPKEGRGFVRRDVATVSVIGVFLLVACASGGDGAPTQTPIASPAAKVVEVGATEYKFSVPPDIRGGVVTMRFTNTGSLPHEFAFGRIDQGRGQEDVRQVLESGQGPPDWMQDVAGVPALSPGRSVTVTRTLEPATYVFLCFFPSPDGTPHAQLGMYTTFQIAGDTGEAPPQADLAISAGGQGLSVPEITAGKHTVELRNEGPGAHGFLILRPKDPAATFEQVFASVEKWLEGGLRGPAPTAFIGGMQSIPAGTSVFETIDFEAGTYIVWDEDSDDRVTVTVS